MTAPALDLFTAIEAPIATTELGDVLAGIELLARSPPLWSIDRGTFWTDLVARIRAFAERWDGPARACGWTGLTLYGVDARAPGARLSSLGAAILIARRGDRVLEVDAASILVTTRHASRLRVYRTAPDSGAVLAWEINGNQSGGPHGDFLVKSKSCGDL